MAQVAVVAHAKKELGGGLDELREELRRAGVDDPDWYEVPKSKKAAKKARKALERGADLVLVWGGDGTVRRCAAELTGTGVPIAILPAGTANLLASNLGVPIDLPAAVQVALHGERRAIDMGVVNGRPFAVMAGAGFDARMIAEADHGLKDRYGRLAYVWTGMRAMRGKRVRTEVDVDGRPWFRGRTSCVLLSNVRAVTGGVAVFDDARPDDGRLEVGVVLAGGVREWLRVFARVLSHQVDRSPLVRSTTGRDVDVRLSERVTWQLDGNDRKATDHLEAHVDALSLVVCVPRCGEP